MKYSMMSYTLAIGDWGKECNIETLCKFTKSLNITAVDWVTTYNSTPKDVKKIMDDYGLITCCHTFFTDINYSNKADRLKGIDDIKQGIDVACELGTNMIMLPFSGKDIYTREESRRNILSGIKEVADYAKSHNVIMTVEHFPGYKSPFLISDDMIKAHNEIDNLFVTYDSGNMISGGEESVDSFIKTKDITKFIHFKDYTISKEPTGIIGVNGEYYTPALIGEGIINYKDLVKQVNENYNGYVNIEYEGRDYTPEVAVEKAIKYLDSLA